LAAVFFDRHGCSLAKLVAIESALDRDMALGSASLALSGVIAAFSGDMPSLCEQFARPSRG